MSSTPNPPENESSPVRKQNASMHWLLRLVLWSVGIALAGALSLLIVIGLALAVAFPNLPDISDLSDYRPKLPLRIFSAEGDLLAEFGEERRNLTPLPKFPRL